MSVVYSLLTFIYQQITRILLIFTRDTRDTWRQNIPLGIWGIYGIMQIVLYTESKQKYTFFTRDTRVTWRQDVRTYVRNSFVYIYII